MRDVVASVLLLSGVALTVVAGIGLLRFPDLYSRMHAATKPQTLGLLLAVAGAGVAIDDDSARAKLLLVAVFGLLTAPVAAHMIGRAGYRAGTGALDELVVDELRDAPGTVDQPGRAGPPGRRPRGRAGGRGPRR